MATWKYRLRAGVLRVPVPRRRRDSGGADAPRSAGDNSPFTGGGGPHTGAHR